MIRAAIAEDDFRVAMIHEQFLSQIEGVELAGKALNGAETLELLKESSIDLLLLDIYMPDILGVELIQKIRESGFQTDIIMITASDDKEMVEKALRSGIMDYIIKPATFERFKATIEKYKAKRSLFNRNDVTQQMIDQYFGIDPEIHTVRDNLPKGIDPLTFEKVKEILKKNPHEGMTAGEVGEKMGASRTTARRYLEYLVSENEVTAELSYGIVGRPERIYSLN
jgi:two-component system, CitB family, response regulator CitT